MGALSSKLESSCLEVHSEDVTRHGVATRWKFRSMCDLAGKAVLAPCDSDKLLIYDPTTNEITVKDVTSHEVVGHHKFFSICAVAGKAVLAPCDSDKLLIYDHSTDEITAEDVTRHGITGLNKFFSICAVAGKAVLAPGDSDKLLVYDPSTGQITVEDVTRYGVIGNLKFKSICAVAGKAVLAPCNSDKLLIYDPSTGQITAEDVTMYGAIGNFKFESICAVAGKAILAPSNLDKLLIYDPSTRQITVEDIAKHGITRQLHNKFFSICAVAGKAVLAPCNSDKLLIYDPSTGQITVEDVTKHGVTGDSKFKGICALVGKAILAPFDSDKLLEYDPSTGKITAVDVTRQGVTGHGKFWSICAVAGKAVLAPCNSDKLLIPKMKLEWPLLPRSLHPSTSSQQCFELAASVLSNWIYHGSENMCPHMPGACFDVHYIETDLVKIGALDFASVTCTWPKAPDNATVFIAFKGTSQFLDALNWNLEYDYELTGSNMAQFFVHKGAASTMRGCAHLFLRALGARLRQAADSGVKRLIFTGHSLGGMYAQVCMLLVHQFRERRLQAHLAEHLMDLQEAPEAMNLLQEATSVTFGSPMVFGSMNPQSEETTAFRTFAKKKMVNYIHACDPCPRAWGALDIKTFLDGQLQEKVQEKAGVVVCTAMQCAIGDLPGIVLQQAINLAKNYEHFAEIRVLSAKGEAREFWNWKEDFSLAPQCMKDHEMVQYVERLFEAYQMRDKCQIYAENGHLM